MDIKKQPGIQCRNVILADCEFKRVPDFPESNVTLSYNFSYTKECVESEASALLNLKLIAKNTNEEIVLQLGCTYVGIFCADPENPNMEMEHFLKHNAPAIILPYIRCFVHYTTAQSGIEPIILPPINIVALVASSEPDSSISDTSPAKTVL